ncbi:L-threonylcarbamoyladenylate synthase [Pullulanibacillus sp. KACC 23026]|uniref:L-threonylcarbamoyladenylate synthase n=1 Tax=Pullulanibacillus sp. KACC 23026 TaxID=3028315 RepID=UPI0023B05831|nr:L-threonylcarbamoyladenylate synthase [Pullulanibacillus sp. KACC 23026]WEG14874.1 L-threonylcarbamoyladenylate synthase [Pullulanibacillus sp. KACC 23026]
MEAADLLKKEEVVAFPTETVYGLGANAYSSEAVQKIYEAKGRPSDNPLIIHIAEEAMLAEVAAVIPESAKKLIERFWPGPLTVVLPKKGPLSPLVTAGLDTVGIRMPNHPIALALIKLAGVPLAAPSANRSGKPSPTQGRHVVHDLKDRIAGVVDAGPTGVGVESTVVDCTTNPVTLLRPGGITLEELEDTLGPIRVDPHLEKNTAVPRSPGMKYTHYAPNAPLVLVESFEKLEKLLKQAKEEGKVVGILTTEERQSFYKEADYVLSCGRRAELATVASHLYDCLRQFDQLNVDLILSEAFPVKGVGEAIMNRLQKAAGGNTVKAD